MNMGCSTLRTLQRILHVEDEDGIRAVARLTLEHLGGFTVESCRSGEEALSSIAEFDPDLVLLDVMMPGLDGPETLMEIRKLPGFKDTPIVFMTAKDQFHELECCLAMGAADVVIKPFDPSTL